MTARPHLGAEAMTAPNDVAALARRILSAHSRWAAVIGLEASDAILEAAEALATQAAAIAALQAEVERAKEEAAALRFRAERGEHLARTVSQVRFRLETGDRYSVSMFDANNMVGLARSASRKENTP